MICSVNDVRIIGKLPPEEKIPDQFIMPHLLAAGRELKNIVGDYADTTDEVKKEACKYSEACLAIANALPALNTFYTAMASTMQAEIGGIDFVFSNPQDVETLQKMWRAKAKETIIDYIEADKEADTFGLFAI